MKKKQIQDPMSLALQAAYDAATCGEVPVGAVVYDPKSHDIIAVSGNRVEREKDATFHAELIVVREAMKKLGQSRLDGFDLYVTLEPCTMCAGAIGHSRIRRLYFGAYDPKGGGVEHGARFFDRETCHHRPEIIGGVREKECAQLLKSFFKNIRQDK